MTAENTKLEQPMVPESSSQKEGEIDISQDIDPENEVTGIKLVLIHIAICLCTFLVGLV